jgi:hypothetical protein
VTLRPSPVETIPSLDTLDYTLLTASGRWRFRLSAEAMTDLFCSICRRAGRVGLVYFGPTETAP